jgi:hypothetical protein
MRGVARVSKTKELKTCYGAKEVKNRPSQFWKEPSRASGIFLSAPLTAPRAAGLPPHSPLPDSRPPSRSRTDLRAHGGLERLEHQRAPRERCSHPRPQRRPPGSGVSTGSLQLNRGFKRVLTTQQGLQKGPYNSIGASKGSLQLNRGFKRVLQLNRGFKRVLTTL